MYSFLLKEDKFDIRDIIGDLFYIIVLKCGLILFNVGIGSGLGLIIFGSYKVLVVLVSI